MMYSTYSPQNNYDNNGMAGRSPGTMASQPGSPGTMSNVGTTANMGTMSLMTMTGRSAKLHPDQLYKNPMLVPSLAGCDEREVNRKVDNIRQGDDMSKVIPPFPEYHDEDRRCKDVLWAILFGIFALAIIATSISYSADVIEMSAETLDHNYYLVNGTCERNSTAASYTAYTEPESVVPDSEQNSNIFHLVAAGTAGALASAGATLLFLVLVHRFPSQIIWASLIFGPVACVVAGITMVSVGLFASDNGGGFLAVIGFCLIALGICLGLCVFCAWRRHIPFMAALTELVADVIEQHKSMVFVSLVGSIMAVLWTTVCAVALLGIYLENWSRCEAPGERKFSFGIFFIMALAFNWGAQVACNICHVTYCGVFGRWYCGYDDEDEHDDPVTESLKIACTTSLGSVCLGSLLVSIVRAIQAVINSLRKSAMEEGNLVTCLIYCCMECIANCIGDILEYFNEWAYVQCAIRGESFCQAAVITLGMLTCGHMHFIINDLLINSVVTFGAVLCAIAGASFGYFVGWMIKGFTPACFGAMIGFVGGLVSGAAGVGIISSGVKTILSCYADPACVSDQHDKLWEERQTLAQEFERKINEGNMDTLAKTRVALQSVNRVNNRLY